MLTTSKPESASAIDIGLDQIARKLSAIWIVDLTENVILGSVVVIQAGQVHVVNNYPAIRDVRSMGNVEMGLVSARRVGTDAIARYVRL